MMSAEPEPNPDARLPPSTLGVPESLRQLREIFDCAPDAILCVDRDYNFVFANQHALHLIGRPDLVGHNMLTLFPGNLADPFHISYRTTMEKRVETEFEAFYPEPLNLWFKVMVRPIGCGIAIFFREISQRKRAEALQSQSARRLAQVFEVTTDAIVSLDREWRITFLNRRAGELLAVKGDLLGKVLWEEFPATSDPAGPYLAPYRRTMEERTPTKIEAFYPEPLNRFFEVESIPSEDGIVQFFRDVTERRLTDRAIRAQRDLLATIQQGAHVASWTLDTSNGEMVYGHGSYPVFGHPLHSVSTLSALLEIVSATDRDQVLAITRSAVRDRTSFTVDFQVIAADGHRIFIEARGQVLDGGDGTLRIGGIAIDISVRKRSEQALHLKQQETERQRAELETVYQTADIALALISAGDLRFLRINEVQAEILGFPQEEIIGKTVMDLAPGVPGIEQIMRGVEEGRPVRHMIVEGELLARPGEPRVWSVSYTPVFGDNGTVVAITSCALEITQQRRAQAALLHSEKLAAVGRLASSISHEINNPLEAVTNLLYLIATDDSLPPALRSYLDTAQEELARVSQIATQTLRFHRQAAKPTRVAPAVLVNAVLHLYQGRLANSAIRVETAYSTSETMLCFENDIRQVLNNLIANAIDAIGDGGRLIIRAHRSTECNAENCVRITVADTGHGMSKVTATRIFDPFFTTKDLNGTGLGLWICAEIVARHHGKLRVRSSRGPAHRGTIFTLILPCDRIPEEAPNPSAYTSAIPTL